MSIDPVVATLILLWAAYAVWSGTRRRPSTHQQQMKALARASRRGRS